MQYFDLLMKFQYNMLPQMFYERPETFMTMLVNKYSVYDILKNNAAASGIFFPYERTDFPMYMDVLSCTDPDIEKITVVSVQYPEPRHMALFSRQYCVMNSKNHIKRFYGIMSGMRPEDVDKKMAVLGVPSVPEVKKQMCADSLVIMNSSGDTEVIGPIKAGVTDEDMIKCVGSSYMGEVHDVFSV